MIKKILSIGIVTVFAAVGLLFSCSQQKPAQAEKTAKTEKAEKPELDSLSKALEDAFAGKPFTEKPVQIKQEDFPEVIATVNGDEIKRGDLIPLLKHIQANIEQGGKKLTEARYYGFMPKVLENMINTKLLGLDAKAKSVKTDEKKVQEKLDRIKKKYGSEKQFKKFLTEKNITKSDFLKDVRNGVLITDLLENHVFNVIKISENEARGYYMANMKKYENPKMVKARHILIKVALDADEAVKKETIKRVEEILKKYENGEKFEDLAKKYSEGPSAPRGGDLGFFRRGVMSKPFEEAAFSMKQGEISGIVNTRFGMHIIKVDEVKEATAIEFDNVKPQIMMDLKIKKKSELFKAYMAKLREKADVKINM
ncbi:MAG: peptidylprolyl isomerase [bacterium]|nr:MAG: peptidylprolyl isomerase [bacterium]